MNCSDWLLSQFWVGPSSMLSSICFQMCNFLFSHNLSAPISWYKANITGSLMLISFQLLFLFFNSFYFCWDRWCLIPALQSYVKMFGYPCKHFTSQISEMLSITMLSFSSALQFAYRFQFNSVLSINRRWTHLGVYLLYMSYITELGQQT